ncbi:MAG: hypothetical protein R3B72_25895 [Polyangiaceae bacterium]
MRTAFLFGALLMAASSLGCSLETIPFVRPSPRSYALPRLVRQCLDGFAEPSAVTIEDYGAEPRRPLRFVPVKERLAKMALVKEDADGKLEVERVLHLSWDAQGGHGQHCYKFELRGALDEALEEESGPVMGVLGIGPHGALMVGTDALDDASYDVEGQLLHRIGFSQPLLPAEPVGVGARWVYATDGHLRGEFVDLRMTYQLLEMTGTKLRLSMDQEVDRPAQTVRGRKGEGTRVEAERRRYRALMEVDLVKAPLPTVRFFDAEGREVEQIVVGWSDG